jgi:ferric-dicitrate binding protein FerR (iron transport regulator)
MATIAELVEHVSKHVNASIVRAQAMVAEQESDGSVDLRDLESLARELRVTKRLLDCAVGDWYTPASCRGGCGPVVVP